MYAEIIFRPNGLRSTRIYADQARSMVGKALDGVACNPLLFNRDANGKTLNEIHGHIKDGAGWALPPAVVYDGGLGFIRVYGIGQAGIDVVQSEAAKIFAGLMRDHGPVAIEMRTGKAVIEQTGYLVPHHIRWLVVGKTPKVCYTDPVSDARIQGVIRRHIVNGLLGQCALLGGDAGGSIPRDTDVEILEGEPTKALAIQNGVPVSAYRNVVFAMPVRLKGPWMAGHLRARGYGMIRAVDPTRGEAA